MCVHAKNDIVMIMIVKFKYSSFWRFSIRTFNNNLKESGTRRKNIVYLIINQAIDYLSTYIILQVACEQAKLPATLESMK